jgi:DNA recombination protein RmuC
MVIAGFAITIVFLAKTIKNGFQSVIQEQDAKLQNMERAQAQMSQDLAVIRDGSVATQTSLSELRASETEHNKNLLLQSQDSSSKLRAELTEVINTFRTEQTTAIGKLTADQTEAAGKSRLEQTEAIEKMRENQSESIAKLRRELVESIGKMRTEQVEAIDKMRAEQTEAIDKMRSNQTEVSELFRKDTRESLNKQMDVIGENLRHLQEDNSKQLDKMRETVDEKLQKTLEDRIGKSFQQVSERLEQVYKGLGEMQTLASGVGDLKKVLSNVKSRGILGEIQLSYILQEILSPEQYEENFQTKKGSSDRVEFAIKLPGDDEGPVYLPIDAKFPGDAYINLVDAYEAGDADTIKSTGVLLDNAIKKAAKDIATKYIDPPNTTDFAIMFLPVEGLYAEVVRRGLVERLQSEYKINIAGPSTMAALLNSLQMGFKTLAIQKRSGEVWNVLGAVKTQFANFEDVLVDYQKRMETANKKLDTLIGVRTRAINSKLKTVTELTPGDSNAVLGFESSTIESSDVESNDVETSNMDSSGADSVTAISSEDQTDV